MMQRLVTDLRVGGKLIPLLEMLHDFKKYLHYLNITEKLDFKQTHRHAPHCAKNLVYRADAEQNSHHI